MVSGRAWVLLVGGAAVALAACRGRAVSRPDASSAGSAGKTPAGAGGGGAEGGEGDVTGGSAGSSAPGSGGQGTAGQGGAGRGGTAQGGAGSGSTAGDAGRSGDAGSAGGFVTKIPNPSEREKEVLAPLGTDDATIDAASGTDLTALARPVGTARGYAICRCALSPTMPPGDELLVEQCAAEETGIRFLTRPDQARCIEEGMAGVPGFEEYLRCLTKWARDDGLAWELVCTNPDHVPVSNTCERSVEASSLIDGCAFVTYCADGTRVSGSRCDQAIQCVDQSDELGCFEVWGKDWFWCDGELMTPSDVCRFGTCGLEKMPPVCDPMRPDRYLCNDGGEVGVETVCDRAFDCADGSDERYCVK